MKINGVYLSEDEEISVFGCLQFLPKGIRYGLSNGLLCLLRKPGGILILFRESSRAFIFKWGLIKYIQLNSECC